jgi:hypothetical protein
MQEHACPNNIIMVGHSNIFNICHLVKHALAPVNFSMSFAF